MCLGRRSWTRSTATCLRVPGTSAKACPREVMKLVEDYDGDTYRAAYTISFAKAVYVLHVFKKKAKSGIGTPQPDKGVDPHAPARRGGALPADLRGSTEEQMSDDLTVHDSCGNVFADMGMPDADERLAKAELARVVRKAIRERGLTQRQAAELLGLQQPDVSDVVRGKLSRFSRQRLERMLNALDMEIRIQVGPRPDWKDHAGITVEHVGSF